MPTQECQTADSDDADGVIGFGLSPFLAVHGGTTSDPDQLRTEIELTAAVGIAGPSTTKPQRPCALIGRLTLCGFC